MLYLYDKTTYEYKGTINDNQPVPLCCYATDVPPPTYGKYEIPVFVPVRNSWIILPDYRGTWYSKNNPNEVVVIHNIGERIPLEYFTNKPCPDPNFYTWDESVGNWVFELNKFKQYRITQLLQSYFDYINSRVPIFKLIGFTSLTLMSKILLDSNVTLTTTESDQIADIIDRSIQLLNWINNVTLYEDEVEAQIKSATSQEEVDNIFESINFNQFDATLPDTQIVPLIKLIQEIINRG